jgi:hypothetical protein
MVSHLFPPSVSFSLRCMAMVLGTIPPGLSRLHDPLVAAWMLSPDAPLEDLDLRPLLCSLHIVASGDSTAIVSHGCDCVGSAAGTGADLTQPMVQYHLLHVLAAMDALTARLREHSLLSVFESQVWW